MTDVTAVRRAVRAGTPAAALALAALVALAGCDSPALTAGITAGPDGLAVTPTVSGTVGGLGVAITPGTIR